MKIIFTSRVLIASVSAALITGAWFSPAAQAITDTVFRYSTPKTGSLMVPAAAFPRSADSGTFTNNGYVLTTSEPGQQCFPAPVNLPQGAILTRMRTWYSRLNTTEVLFVHLRRAQFAATLDITYIVGDQTTQVPVNDGYGRAVYTISGQTINNNIYAYFFYVCIANNAAFHGARIEYTYNTAGD
jgi:hypothetical protein